MGPFPTSSSLKMSSGKARLQAESQPCSGCASFTASIRAAEDRIARAAAEDVLAALREPDQGADAVLGVVGVGSLYGLASVADVLSRVEHAVEGRLGVFFPGRYRDGRYRLYDARESWDYHAVPICLSSGEEDS